MRIEADSVLNLKGRVGLITGAASGIGRATAEHVAALGAKLALLDYSASVDTVADGCRGLDAGVEALAIQGDAGAESDVLGAIQVVDRQWGRLDFVVCCAARFEGWEDPLTTTADVWSEVLRVNLIGPYLAIRHAAPLMRKTGGGAVVLVASVGGLRAGGGGCAYSASKAGLINLAQTSAHALTGSGIRINAISPGLVHTPMSQPIFTRAVEAGTAVGQLNPLQRAGGPDEIASVAAFLVSDAASYVNGQNLTVDGGLSSALPFQR